MLVLLSCCALLAACSRSASTTATAVTHPASAAPGAAAKAVLFGTSNSPASGQLQLSVSATGVSITGEITGLPPGTVHGIHVHEVGDCSAIDATSAGGHFNPDHAQHGGPTSTPRHMGDLSNIEADGQGHARVNATIAGATLRDGGPHDLMGKALIVHDKPDDYMTQPAGDSGDRIACGVVR